MGDYKIIVTAGGEFGVTAQTDQAAKRSPGGLAIGSTLVFKSRAELSEYLGAGEAVGFSFDGKEHLGH